MSCAAVLLGNTVSEGVSCGVAGVCRPHAGICAPSRRAPLHPTPAKELYDILWPVEGGRLHSACRRPKQSDSPTRWRSAPAAALRPWPSTAA